MDEENKKKRRVAKREYVDTVRPLESAGRASLLGVAMDQHDLT